MYIAEKKLLDFKDNLIVYIEHGNYFLEVRWVNRNDQSEATRVQAHPYVDLYHVNEQDYCMFVRRGTKQMAFYSSDL